MTEINGQWCLFGCDESSERCIHNIEELYSFVERVGFVSLFDNGSDDLGGISVERNTSAVHWWSGDREKDPWEWREIAAAEGRVIYGKFFGNKAGFISKEWFPYFANARRNGYDFDSLYEDGKATRPQKAVMDLFMDGESHNGKLLFSTEIKKQAGFGKEGYKNFEGTAASLQMSSYLCIRDFRQKINKKGERYGWPVTVYGTPESLWGYDFVTSAYSEPPEESYRRIKAHLEGQECMK